MPENVPSAYSLVERYHCVNFFCIVGLGETLALASVYGTKKMQELNLGKGQDVYEKWGSEVRLSGSLVVPLLSSAKSSVKTPVRVSTS